MAALTDLMNRADVTISEKYRKILEAYQIEEGFSRTIEAYKASLDKDGDEKTYEFLRVGRIALLYQSPDGSRDRHVEQEDPPVGSTAPGVSQCG